MSPAARAADDAFEIGADHVRGGVVQVTLRELGDIVDEVLL